MDSADCVTVRCCDVQVCVGDATIIHNVTFSCCSGEWVVLSGPSGAGRTTLLRTINGLCPPTTGKIWALGSWMPGRSRRDAQQAWRRTGTVSRELGLSESRSVVSNVAMGLRAAGHPHAAANSEARAWLARFGLDDKFDAYPRLLSGNERQRVALARALAPRPQLLLLDEPTAHLDDGSAKIVITAIKELVQDGATVIMSSDRADELASYQTCQITLEDGAVSGAC